MLKYRNLIATFTTACLFATGLHAQDVTLTSADGALSVEGTLTGFDGEFYHIQSVFGPLTLDGTGVTCGGPGCPSLESFVARAEFAGSALPGETLLPYLVEGFARHADLQVKISYTDDQNYAYFLQAEGSEIPLAEFRFALSTATEGFARLEAGDADFVLSSGAHHSEPTGESLPAPHVLAYDALALAVAADNPLREMPVGQILPLLGQQIESWTALNGPEVPLVLEGESLSQTAEAANTFANILAAWSNREPQLSGVVTDAIARDSFAVGLVRLSDPGRTRALGLRGSCGNLTTPDESSLRTGDYPLVAPQYLHTSPGRKPRIIRAFLRYLSTDDAGIQAARAGFTGRHITETGLADQGARLANAVLQAGDETSLGDLQSMVSVLQTARRLSVTFRFEPGSTTPDTRAISDLAQVALLLESGKWDGKELMFVGFSDGDGDAAANQRIALRRAISIQNALRQRVETNDPNQATFSVHGFGEALPIVCDDSDFGRSMNRRVELWVRDR